MCVCVCVMYLGAKLVCSLCDCMCAYVRLCLRDVRLSVCVMCVCAMLCGVCV